MSKPRVDQVGPQRQRFPIGRGGVAVAPHLTAKNGLVEMGFGVARVERNRFLHAEERRVILFERPEHGGALIESCDMVRLQFKQSIELRQRLRKLAKSKI